MIFFDHVENAWKNGTSDGIGLAGSLPVGNASLTGDDDVKPEVGAQFGFGGKAWLNLTELIDFGKFIINSLRNNEN
jgi:hypothetical protein